MDVVRKPITITTERGNIEVERLLNKDLLMISYSHSITDGIVIHDACIPDLIEALKQINESS